MCSSYEVWTLLIKLILGYFIVWLGHCAWNIIPTAFLIGYFGVDRRGVNFDVILSSAKLMNSLFSSNVFCGLEELSHVGRPPWAESCTAPGWQELKAPTLSRLLWGPLRGQGF